MPAQSASKAATSGALDANELRAFRRDAQIIFQDPYASLNPRMTVGQILAEPLALHDLVPAAQPPRAGRGTAAPGRAGAALCAPLSARIFRRPAPAHRDRAGARGGAEADHLRRAGVGARRLDPLADPQSAARPAGPARPRLHLRLARSRRGEAHRRPRRGDESRRASSRPRDAQALFAAPRHPYSRALLSAIPVPKPQAKRSRIVLQGEMPSALNPPSGCRFHTRCPYVIERCRTEVPQLLADGTGHADRLPPHGGIAAAGGDRAARMAAFRRRWKNWSRPSAPAAEGARRAPGLI